MAVTKKTAVSVATAVKEEAKVELELAAFGRLWLNGFVYERGMRYVCSQKQAVELLAFETGGVRPFKVYEKKKKVAAEDDGVTRLPPEMLPEIIKPTVEVKPETGKISLTSPEEEAELGLPPEDVETA